MIGAAVLLAGRHREVESGLLSRRALQIPDGLAQWSSTGFDGFRLPWDGLFNSIPNHPSDQAQLGAENYVSRSPVHLAIGTQCGRPPRPGSLTNLLGDGSHRLRQGMRVGFHQHVGAMAQDVRRGSDLA